MTEGLHERLSAAQTLASNVHHRKPCLFLLQVILLLDVDFVVTDGLHEQLSAAAAAEALADDLTIHKHAVVLPAFETSPQLSLPAGHSAALQAVSGKCRVSLHTWQP